MLSSVDAIKQEFHLGPVNESFYICCAKQQTASHYTKSSSEQQQFSLVNWVNNRCWRRLRDTQEWNRKVQQQIIWGKLEETAEISGRQLFLHTWRALQSERRWWRCGSRIVVMLHNIKSTQCFATKVLLPSVYYALNLNLDGCCWGGLSLLNLAGLYFYFSKRSSAPINRKVEAQLLQLHINPPYFAGLTGGPHWIPAYCAAAAVLLLPAPSVNMEVAFDNYN